MMLELLRHSGAAAKWVEQNKNPVEVREPVKSLALQLVCLSRTTTECLPAAVSLVVALRADSPNLTIIGGDKAALWDAAKIVEVGCADVCGTRGEARRAIRHFAVTRARSSARLIGPSLGRRRERGIKWGVVLAGFPPHE